MINVKLGATVKTVMLAIVVVLGLGSVAPVQAVPIVGTLNLTGEVIVTEFGIDWVPAGLPDGVANIESSTGYFSNLEGFEARELDLIGIPTDTFVNVPFFETFPNTPRPNLEFTLQLILSCGTVSLFPAIECDAGAESPFVFQQTARGTTVSLFFFGFVTDGDNPGEVSSFTSQFDATFLGMTPESILAQLDEDGFILAPYSAQKIAVDVNIPEIPEPATMLTFGVGTAVLAAHRRRRAKKNAQI